jgi:hypothetical protein
MGPFRPTLGFIQDIVAEVHRESAGPELLGEGGKSVELNRAALTAHWRHADHQYTLVARQT